MKKKRKVWMFWVEVVIVTAVTGCYLRSDNEQSISIERSVPSNETMIVCDYLEINHVFNRVEGDVFTHRFDQVLVRNRYKIPPYFRGTKKVWGGHHSMLVDGWTLLNKCRRLDDAKHRKEWEDWLATTLSGYPPLEQTVIRNKAKYSGSFQSPVTKIGDYYTLRISNWERTVVIKSKVCEYTNTEFDSEEIERRELAHHRRYDLRNLKAAPTVFGDAAKQP
jgi:hypothetical protein